MKKIFIKDINADSDVRDYFLVKQKNICKAKNDKNYLAMVLCYKTGEVNGRVWNDADMVNELFDKGDIIAIKKGSASLWQKKLQISIAVLEKVERNEVDMADFVQTSRFPVDDMINELKSHIDRVKNVSLNALLNSFFDDAEFIKAFSYSSAAKAVHHNYVSGLLEHTLSVTRLVSLLKQNYPELNEDLLIAGAILHDIGKIKELSPDIGFEYTDPGRLLGHIVIGTIMIDKRIEAIPGFPPQLADLLKHMVLSHHGIYEWGSPKRPKTVEAYLLHCADDLDAKIVMMQNAINKDVADDVGWTGYNPLLERYLYKPAGEFEVDVAPAPTQSAQAAEKPESKPQEQEPQPQQAKMF